MRARQAWEQPFVPDQDEVAFVARLRAGDEDACAALVQRYGGRLLAAARRLLRDEEEARDAVQEGFFLAFRSLDRFEGASRLSTWLHRIVINAALMRIRSASRRPEQSIEDLLPRFADDGRFAEAPRWNAPGDELLEERETRAAVRACIARLPEAYRTVVLLRDIEDLDTAETAAVLGLTENAVKVRLHRGRQALRTMLTDAVPSSERLEQAS